MSLFAEQTNTLEPMSSLIQEELWRARNMEIRATEMQTTELQDTEMQAYINSVCESLGMDQEDLNEQNPMTSYMLNQSQPVMSASASVFEPWSAIQSKFTDPTPESVAFSPDQTATSSWPDTPDNFSPPPHIVDPAYIPASENAAHVFNGLLDPQTPELSDIPKRLSPPITVQEYRSISSPTPSSLQPYPARPQSTSEKQSCHSGPVAPSKRSSPKHKTVSRPYSLPSSRALIHGKFSVASSSTKAESRRNGKEYLAAFPIPTPKNRIGQNSSRVMISYSPLSIPSASLSRKLIRTEDVGLRVWRPLRAHKLPPDALGVINFETIHSVTGKITPGTFLADRFQEHTGRFLRNEDTLPFPGKKEKGFNLRVLWPGYNDDFSKKISIHKPLSECTVRDVRDWVFNALSDFIRTYSAEKVAERFDRRVGADPADDAIHLEDLILMQLKQAGRGTWVPVLHLCFWEKEKGKGGNGKDTNEDCEADEGDTRETNLQWSNS